MKTLTNDHYTYRITWSEEDNEYIGLCAEFPSISWLASSPQAAFKGVRDVVNSVVVEMKKSNEPIPEPLAEKKFSGKFMVRIPPNVHRDLTLKAAEAGISLNRLVSEKLTR